VNPTVTFSANPFNAKYIIKICVSVVEYFPFEDTVVVEMETINSQNDSVLNLICNDEIISNMADKRTYH
jgi:hypothetical protein